MEVGAGRKGVMLLCRFLTPQESLLRKQELPLKTEFKPNQSATQPHTHMSQVNPKLVGPDRLDWTQKEQVSGGDRKVASSLCWFLLKSDLWKASKSSKGQSLPSLLQRASLVVGATGPLPSGPSGF